MNRFPLRPCLADRLLADGRLAAPPADVAGPLLGPAPQRIVLVTLVLYPTPTILYQIILYYWQPPMYKSNMSENPEKQTAWICRLDQYPPMILNPSKS